MNKILPIILIISLFLVPDLLIAREGYEGYSPRTGGSSGGNSDSPFGALLVIIMVGGILILIYGIGKMIFEDEENPIASLILVIGFFALLFYGLSS